MTMSADKERLWVSDRTSMAVHCQAAKESLEALLAKDKVERKVEIDEHCHIKWCPICTRR